MYLYNSASRKKELFVPNHPDIVKMYTCGPTVYHYAHIGNRATPKNPASGASRDGTIPRRIRV